ncbi:heavy metal translocatin [Cucurbitaria berberidis CBS 394.84]|uniref:Heavy metal translocatin n=1 Tax=Cucurbitaria berberidis CBS 394.84 TaxID=1168544 RepID=A0A9P4G7S1_9PLEO|nr:heavy metal translocatin [Cucurbitaria berberidis CBS 394.84]KAF1840600.1 heavy metal translocatin [Cucurbitaria berberidis CBS 394.84]
MSPTVPNPRLRGSRQEIIMTTCFISNLHCPSCVEGIKASLGALEPAPEEIVTSIVSHSVVVRHTASIAVEDILGSLEAAGFEMHSVFQDDKPVYDPKIHQEHSKEWHTSLEHAVSDWLHPRGLDSSNNDMRKKELHLEKCEQCKREHGGISLDINHEAGLPFKPEPIVTTSPKASLNGSASFKHESPSPEPFVTVEPTTAVYKATLALSGMTCSSCVSAITHAVQQHPWVLSIDVNLLTSSGVVVFNGKHRSEEVIETIEDCGFDVSMEKLEEIQSILSATRTNSRSQWETWRATYALGGLTCAACVGNVNRALEPHTWIEQVDINLISNSATIIFKGKKHLPEIKEIIEDAGYEARLDKVLPVESVTEEATNRSVAIHIDGMFCHHCPANITSKLTEAFSEHYSFEVDGPSLTLQSPMLRIKYNPESPQFTIRTVFDKIRSLNAAFKPSVHHTPTIEERGREMHAQERKRILFRLVLCIIVAIPTFVLGVVFMSLIDSKHPIRRYVMGTMWAGNVTRLNWALFILATPIYLFAADTFHRRAIKEVKAMWRPGSRTPLSHRFIRFGSMNMLISLGTSIAYFASVVELVLAATKKSSGAMNDSYFDAVVFLTMFLLIGRFLEAYSKAKTGDAVTSLGNLRPEEAILVDPEKGDTRMATDLLEIGDIVRVNHGTSPPFDGNILNGSSTFDESSLTGESRPVKKGDGDTVYSGTVNKGAPVNIRITTVAGTSMLDQIINAVREGQTRRAPVERVADTITSHFVPFVIAAAIATWLVWLVLGTTGAIPKDWKNEGAGGWALWSLRFAIAVFVIACPCGIGLAAPTALFVGGGLAAKHGILVKGGGEAFQEASSLDCVVFDKTGTLTQGGDPAVTNHKISGNHNCTLVLGIVKALEENSNHPVARALVSFCKSQLHDIPVAVNVDEVPGKGLKGTFRVEGHDITAIIGNESFMADHHVPISADNAATLHTWKSRGESVALVAVFLSQLSHDSRKSIDKLPESSKVSESLSTAITESPLSPAWDLAGLFSIADPLRPEAINVIEALKARDIDVWMLSGDNPITANAVGSQVGIPTTNIIAGVLPDQKAEKIRLLQRTLMKRRRSSLFSIPILSKMRGNKKRVCVAMVGDGINDAPALSTADLSIAIGSGSDIALSSSSFILINSRLTTILTLLDLSRVVFRRVYFNFGWALIYNLIAMPIAAGVLFPITTGTKHMDMHHNGMAMEGGMAMESGGKKHIRLDPVWASLAMALSSVSVVCSSLALRSRVPGIGFRVKKDGERS